MSSLNPLIIYLHKMQRRTRERILNQVPFCACIKQGW